MEEKKIEKNEEVTDETLDDVAGGKFGLNTKGMFVKCKCGAIWPKPKDSEFIKCKCGNIITVNPTTLGGTMKL